MSPKGECRSAQREGKPVVQRPRRRPGPSPRPARGVVTLVLVLGMFFVMALIAGYASRNLIFEQRTSVNHARAMQASEAAIGGMQWALAMLNGARIDTSCQTSTDTRHASFRDRYLGIDANGLISPITYPNALGTATQREVDCQRMPGGGLQCDCPMNSPATLTPAEGATPAFRLRFGTALGTPQEARFRLTTLACSRWDRSCLANGFSGSEGHAASYLTVTMGLARGLPTPPLAALTARGNVLNQGRNLTVSNTDAASGGLGVLAGGNLNGAPIDAYTVAGSDNIGLLRERDAGLSGLSATQMFVSTFGKARDTYQRQMSLVLISSCTSRCGDKLQTAARDNPGRILWVEGDADLDTGITLGSASEPVLLVVNGSLNFIGSGSVLNGVVYVQAENWHHNGREARVVGALIAEGNVRLSAPLTLVYDAGIVSLLHHRSGTFVPVPGSWLDPV